MRDDEVIALIAVLVISAVALTVYVGVILLGVNMAKRKNRTPHWFWFAVHPVGLLITLIVMACRRRCNAVRIVSKRLTPTHASADFADSISRLKDTSRLIKLRRTCRPDISE